MADFNIMRTYAGLCWAVRLWAWQAKVVITITQTIWTNRKTNLEVLTKVKERKRLLQGTELTKIKWIQHMIRFGKTLWIYHEHCRRKDLRQKIREKTRDPYLNEMWVNFMCKRVAGIKSSGANNNSRLQMSDYEFQVGLHVFTLRTYTAHYCLAPMNILLLLIKLVVTICVLSVWNT